MALPSTRELELEALVRQRDAQIEELTDDITRLRRHLSIQQGPAVTDPVTLSPSVLAVLRPHIRNAAKVSSGASSTVINALIQRSRILQEENDELYDILKLKETGKLKEEVRGLRRVVQRLESGLRESHNVITALSTELDKTHEALLATSKHVSTNPPTETRHDSRSPRTSSLNNGSGRHPPTGPRAFKKQRLSDAREDSPPPMAPLASRPPPPPNPHRQYGGHTNSVNSRSGGGNEQHHQRHSHSYNNSDRDRDREQREFASSAGLPSKPQTSRKMDVDEDKKERRPRGDRDRQRDNTTPSGDGGSSKDRSSSSRAVTISGGISLSTKDRSRGGGGGNGRDRDRNAENGTGRSSHSQNHNGRNSHTTNSTGGSLSVRGAGRRNDQRTTGTSSTREAFDRTLAERMGL